MYIFLDIDGVMNCRPSRLAAMRLQGEAEQSLALAAAPSLLTNLKSIVVRTGAHIVLSSTWRLGATDIVEERLRSAGLALLGATPQLCDEEDGAKHLELTEGPDGEFSPELERSIEISRWLARQGDGLSACFVAIDDMDLVGAVGSRLTSGDQFVQTDDSVGLSRRDAEAAIAKLLMQRSHYQRAKKRQAMKLQARAEAATAGSSSDGDDDDGDDVCLCASWRFDFRAPARRRDAAVLALYNDAATMLPHLPMLCPMSAEAMSVRREAHRAGRANGSSCFMDIVHRASGELVGTAGFRAVAVGGSAEFGIVVRREWQRRGVCCEAFVANAAYAWSALRCTAVVASTLEANERMRAFCARAGLSLTGRRADHGLEWWVHESPIEALQWSALAPS